ncbi:hypothetical protein REPUB_Repub12eG0013700 [Reevesia pubescens]
MIWLFNPFTFTIGTRGNCEPIVCAMILWIIICLMNVQLVLIFCFAKDLLFCFFVQTVAFVAFNKRTIFVRIWVNLGFKLNGLHYLQTWSHRGSSLPCFSGSQQIFASSSSLKEQSGRLEIDRDDEKLDENGKTINHRHQDGKRSRKFVEAEQVAVRWPTWLSSAAAEAVHGWVPLQADARWFNASCVPTPTLPSSMENLNMALLSSSSSPNLFLLGYNNPNHSLKNPTKTFTFRTSKFAPRRSPISAHASPPRRLPQIVIRKLGDERFASISSSSNQQTSSVGVNPNSALSPPSSQIGSPLFWIGVGVGLSALFTWKYAMQQAFKTMMGQMNTQNNQFGNTAFPPGSPFPFPAPPSPGPATARFPSSSQPAVTVDIPATKVEAAPVTDPSTEVKSVKNETETTESKKYAFVDVSPEDTVQKSAFEDVAEPSSSNNAQFPKDVSDNGAASKQDAGAFGGFQTSGGAGPTLSVDALEKMMEDPTVQKMVYPYLPEEMRNPETFKWMLQNPQYRQQLQDMLNNMGGSAEWDNRMMESLKNFDLDSPEVKQQFDQIGLTPEEVISKIMANPEVAMAFQNPRVQAAIMDCSQNPLSIAKYQNDKEVMDVFNKISELFPGVTGSP